MPDPRDPDTEDRRNDRDLDDDDRGRSKFEPDQDIDEVVIDLDMFDDESIMIDFDADDGRDIERSN